MLKITSRDNKRLKFARKIRDGHIKDAIFIEGLRLTEEALKSNLELSECFLSESFFANENNSEFLNKINDLNIQVFALSDKIFESISDTRSSQGVILTGVKPEKSNEILEDTLKLNSQKSSLILLLHEINNPSNLGAILRTAEAAGVLGIVTTKSSANVFSPKAIRGAMGASFRLPVWENIDFDQAINWAKLQNLTTICADINSEKSFREIDWKKQYLLVFGSEAHGLKDFERNQIDESIFIPMENNVESLNLAVACGIILFEAKKK